MQVEHLHRDEHGITLIIPHSKSDQEGKGRRVWLPFGKNPHRCPVSDLDAWIAAAHLTTGPIWREVNKADRLGAPLRRGERVNTIVSRLAAAARLPGAERYTGHSMRAGFITAAAEAGATDREIANQSGHAPGSRSLHRYIRHNAAHTESAAGRVI